MSSHRRPTYLALLGLMIVPPIGVFAAVPWLKNQPDEIGLVLSGLAATLAVAASLMLAVLNDRRLDEWNRSRARFASQWGWTAGACLVALLLSVPQVREFVVFGAGRWAEAPSPDQKLVLITFIFGFMAVVVAQIACTALLSAGWALWMSRGPGETREEQD